MPKVAKEKEVFNPKALERMRELAPLDLAKARAIAAEFGLKERSVIAKAVREKIAYTKQERVRKDGKPIASKEATVAAIEESLNLAEGVLDGLEKAAKVSLERLRDALAGFADAENEVE